MSRFVISDLHFGHSNILTFNDETDKPIRIFKDVEEMNETIIDNWNKVIHDKDRVYVLGDIAMPRKSVSLMGRLKGSKVLVKGNHDMFSLKYYLPYFDDIRSLALVDNRAIMTHIPIHPDCLGRFKLNIHGHLHKNLVTKREYIHYPEEQCWKPENVPDKRYINVCVEQINYTPISIEELLGNQ